jgi:hypothetical protein
MKIILIFILIGLLFSETCKERSERLFISKNLNIEDFMSKCGFRCAVAGNTKVCSLACLNELFPDMGNFCNECYAGAIQCTKKNCLWKCIFGRSEKCVLCTQQRCTTDMNICINKII